MSASSGTLLSYLEGTWELSRFLSDRHRSLEGRFSGIATFTPLSGETCSYLEEGTLDWPGHHGPATRSLLCRAQSSEVVAFLFTNGGFFHDLVLSEVGHDVIHLCGSDRYDGHFESVGATAWQATWRIEGPSKSLLLDAHYRRSALV